MLGSEFYSIYVIMFTIGPCYLERIRLAESSSIGRGTETLLLYIRLCHCVLCYNIIYVKSIILK